MKNARTGRGFQRGKFGLDQNLVLFLALSLFLMAFFFGSLNNSQAAQQFESLKSTNIFLTDNKKAEIEALSLLENVNIDLTGQYNYLVDYGSGMMLRGDLNVDVDTVTRRISVNHQSMYATAHYEVVGSTVQYTDIQGDRYLFNEGGTAIGHDPEHGVYLELDGDVRLFVEAQYTAETYQPLNKTPDLTLIERIVSMSVWMLLQNAFILLGVGVLAYVLYRLIKDTRNGSGGKQNEMFSA